MLTIGIDLGSSSVKLSLLDTDTGNPLAAIQLPEEEMKIDSPQSGWAEQNPEMWWNYVSSGIQKLTSEAGNRKTEIKAIGISYQMHGLVCIAKDLNVVRPSVIWCDSRAATVGKKAFDEIGAEKCLARLLNSPGNFTASKLAWVKQNEPENYAQIHKIMLPGDYIAMKLTGELTTTASGLSEGIFWDFENKVPAGFLLDHFGISQTLLSDLVPQFGHQGKVLNSVAGLLGLPQDVVISYRAGDQPNNAFSLNVLQPGEVAATAGTSGVVYGVTDQVKYDPLSRVNTFLHVNHTDNEPRLGVLLCINGTGILNSWLKNNVASGLNYYQMNDLAVSIPAGAEGLTILPFGNGAERMLLNDDTGCSLHNLQLNIHTKAHLIRAAHEGIAFAFKYGMNVMQESGFSYRIIRAGKANMFLSPVFRQTLSTITGAEIQLYNTDGSLGAARGAAVGCGIYSNFGEAFSTLKVLETIQPQYAGEGELAMAYSRWLESLNKELNKRSTI